MAAVYSLTVDPLLIGTPDTPVESDRVEAQAGCALPSAGDVSGDGETAYADLGAKGGISDPPGDPACMDPSFTREKTQCQDGLNNDHAIDTN